MLLRSCLAKIHVNIKLLKLKLELTINKKRVSSMEMARTAPVLKVLADADADASTYFMG